MLPQIVELSGAEANEQFDAKRGKALGALDDLEKELCWRDGAGVTIASGRHPTLGQIVSLHQFVSPIRSCLASGNSSIADRAR